MFAKDWLYEFVCVHVPLAHINVWSGVIYMFSEKKKKSYWLE